MAERSIQDLACKALAQERGAVQAALIAFTDAYAAPADGSPCATDKAWVRTQPLARRKHLAGVLDMAVHDGAEMLRSAAEHVRGVEALLRSDAMLPIPAMTLVRSVHEAVITVCSLVDPSLSTEERLARAAATSLAMAQGSHRALADVPHVPRDEELRVREAYTGMQRYFKKIGFILGFGREPGGPYALNVRFGESPVVSLAGNTTAASRKYAPAIHFIWTAASGATHSRLWFTRGLEGPWPDAVVMIATPLLDMSDALVDNALRYVGSSPDDAHRRTHMRRVALLGRVRPSDLVAGYEDYAREMLR